jgi:hypothetical protein
VPESTGRADVVFKAVKRGISPDAHRHFPDVDPSGFGAISFAIRISA